MWHLVLKNGVFSNRFSDKSDPSFLGSGFTGTRRQSFMVLLQFLCGDFLEICGPWVSPWDFEIRMWKRKPGIDYCPRATQCKWHLRQMSSQVESKYKRWKFQICGHLCQISFSVILPFLSNLASIYNVANKSLHGEEQNKFNQIIVPIRDWTQDLLIVMPMLYWLS